jgi:hypothetical protein
MKVKIYIEMIIQREIGLGSEGVVMSWIIVLNPLLLVQTPNQYILPRPRIYNS